MTSTKPPDNEFGARSTAPDPAAIPPASQNRLEQHPASARQVSAPAYPAGPIERDPEAASGNAPAINSRSATAKLPSTVANPDRVTSAAEERAEILKRIAAFRNLQIKMRQDREKYYDDTLARTRVLLSKPIKPRH
jgi:hypothetical protein